jgi:serine palmitoyltransferase
MTAIPTELPSLATHSLTQNIYNLGRVTGQTLRKLEYGGPIEFINAVIESVLAKIESTPDLFSLLSKALIQYKTWWLNLVKTDPIHVLIETLLISFLAYLLFYQKKKDYRTKMKDRLSDNEIQALLADWKETGRVALSSDGDRMNGGSSGGAKKERNKSPMEDVVIEKMEGSKVEISIRDSNGNSNMKHSTRTVLNFATNDFLGMSCPSDSKSDVVKKASVEALSKYGCGSCGPRGFYGTIDAHLDLEDAMAKFTETDGAILYSDGASCVASTVAAFAKRGDLIIADESIYEALGTGITLSRANVKYFKHNDMDDLRKVLERVQATDESLGRKKNDQRRFIVVEGLYKNYGSVCPLDKLIKLKEEFCYRLILDESHSFGAMGETGRGALEHFGLKPMQHAEIICIGLENAMGSIGGVTVGNQEVVDHQRLSGAGYCFSASLPPFLATAAQASLKSMVDSPEIFANLKENMEHFHNELNSSGIVPSNLYVSSEATLSPLVYLQLTDESLTIEEEVHVLNRIATKCLENGVLVVSTGSHVFDHLHKIPPPSLRITIMTKQSKEEITNAVSVLKNVVDDVCNE